MTSSSPRGKFLVQSCLTRFSWRIKCLETVIQLNLILAGDCQRLIGNTVYM